jgi:protein farnesyltransferase subunit beta
MQFLPFTHKKVVHTNEGPEKHNQSLRQKAWIHKGNLHSIEQLPTSCFLGSNFKLDSMQSQKRRPTTEITNNEKLRCTLCTLVFFRGNFKMAFFQGFDDMDEMGSDLAFDDEDFQTATSLEQQGVEEVILRHLERGRKVGAVLRREEHETYLRSALEGLSPNHAGLDSSKPWLCYWICHALDVLGADLPPRLTKRVVEYMFHCQSPSGGFCGGPQQLAHLAPTYASVLTLAGLGREDAFCMIDRKKMYSFLMSLKQPDGSFSMHLDGEADVRATYCAVTIASLLDLMTPELLVSVADFVVRCQTHEGGFGGFPGNEAHGGYTFCGAAAASILGVLATRIDCEGLLEWVSRRQMKLEGGFSGRANKLVDACYSFWVGAVPVIVQRELAASNADRVLEVDAKNFAGDYVFDQLALQEYLLLCCQNPRGTGGMIDKPGKSADLYHTCYALSGLSLAQHNFADSDSVLGSTVNLLRKVDPVYNVVGNKAQQMMQFFQSRGQL